jgi:hypothetical protein
MRETGNLIFVKPLARGRVCVVATRPTRNPRIANTAKPAADGDAAHNGSWPDILVDLDSMTETEVEQDGKHFLLSSAPRPATSLNLRAAGVALPRRRLIPLHQPRRRRSV